MTISAERPVQNDAVPIERQNPELSIDVEWPRIAAHVREAPSEPGFRPAPCVSIQAQPPDVCPREPFHVEPEAPRLDQRCVVPKRHHRRPGHTQRPTRRRS